MRPEARELLAAAAETRFPAETLEKVARLGEIAVEIGRHPFLGETLALKRGTALNLFAEAPPRPHRENDSERRLTNPNQCGYILCVVAIC